MYKNLHLKKYDNTKFFCCPSPFKTLAPQSPHPQVWNPGATTERSLVMMVSYDISLLSGCNLQKKKKNTTSCSRRVLEGLEGSHIQLCSKLFNPPDFFPLTSIVNKSCKIECCVNSMLPINQNMIVSQGLQLILGAFRRTTISYQHPLI